MTNVTQSIHIIVKGLWHDIMKGLIEFHIKMWVFKFGLYWSLLFREQFWESCKLTIRLNPEKYVKSNQDNC